MNLAPIVTRLRDQTGGAFREVGTAADFAALIAAGVPAAPSAYVLPLSDQAGENYLMGVTAQRVGVLFGVLLVVRSAVDSARGGGTLDALEPLRDAVRAALHGWQPGADAEPCLYQGGELLGFESGALSWLETWATAHELRTAQ